MYSLCHLYLTLYVSAECVQIIRDRETGISRGFGFGFVTFVHKSSVDAAVQGLHGKQLDGGTLLVLEHKPRRDRPRRL
jgi:RNA recognition motif-containing protein